MFASAPSWRDVGRYMNMIINVGPVLIGAYEKSVRAGKYGYDGWWAAAVRGGQAVLCGGRQLSLH